MNPYSIAYNQVLEHARNNVISLDDDIRGVPAVVYWTARQAARNTATLMLKVIRECDQDSTIAEIESALHRIACVSAED